MEGGGIMGKIKRLLWHIPVMFGASTLLLHGARAAVPDPLHDADQQPRHIGEVLIKLENDQIYFSEDDGLSFQELELMATPQATNLKRLLRESDRSEPGRPVKVTPTVVADGAGGAQWARPKERIGAAEVGGLTAKPATDRTRFREPDGAVQSKPE